MDNHKLVMIPIKFCVFQSMKNCNLYIVFLWNMHKNFKSVSYARKIKYIFVFFKWEFVLEFLEFLKFKKKNGYF